VQPREREDGGDRPHPLPHHHRDQGPQPTLEAPPHRPHPTLDAPPHHHRRQSPIAPHSFPYRACCCVSLHPHAKPVRRPKVGRLMRLFVDGAPRRRPEAEFVIREDGGGIVDNVLLGMDASGAKYFDGEIAEAPPRPRRPRPAFPWPLLRCCTAFPWPLLRCCTAFPWPLLRCCCCAALPRPALRPPSPSVALRALCRPPRLAPCRARERRGAPGAGVRRGHFRRAD